MAKKTKTKEPKKTLATKTATVTKNEKEKVETIETEVVEQAKKEGKYPPQVQEPVKTPEEPVKKEDETPIVKNEEPITPEVVESTEKKEDETPVPSISAGLNKLANGDRLDHNHAVDLMKMIHGEYVTNPATTPELGKAMKRQFDAMAMVELMFYNAQLESDLQQLGVKVNKEQFTQIEQLARSMFGISLKSLPTSDPNQLVINFPESIPNTVKEQVKKDLKEKKEVTKIPDPVITMPEAEKQKVLRVICSSIGKGVGNNVTSVIEWARKAYGFTDQEKKSVIFANILQKDLKTTLINGLTSMVKGRLNHDHSILGAHAVLHQWLPTFSEEEIAEIAQVCLSYKEEISCKEYIEKTGQKCNIDNSIALISREIMAGRTEDVINGIVGNKEQVVVKYLDGTGSVAVNTESVRKGLTVAYGSQGTISDSMLKDVASNIVKLYVKPIMRLSKYIDKSAYSTAIA